MKKIILLLGILILLLAGCDSTVTPEKIGDSVTTGDGMVRIYVGNTNDDARTLQPAHNNIEGYQLTFDALQTRTVRIDMYDNRSDGWDGNGTLRININGIDHTVRLNSGGSGTQTLNVNTGDIVNVYWTGNNNTYHWESSFIIYYEDTPPSPVFNRTSWSGSNALLFRTENGLSNSNLNQLLGSFTVPSAGIPPDPVNIPSPGNSADVYFADGSYTITAKAYSLGGTIGNPADEAASGSVTDIIVSGGAVTSNSGIIPPIILLPTGSGQGALSFNISLDGADTGSEQSFIKLYDINEQTPFFEHLFAEPYPDQIDIPAGRYVAEIQLVNASGEIAFYRDVVEIWKNAATNLIFTPDFVNPDLGLAYSGSTLSEELTTFDDSIEGGYLYGTGATAANAMTYNVTVDNFADVNFVMTPDSNSQYADISWFANTGSIPNDNNYTKEAITDFTLYTALWVKVVSEDATSTTYYRFNLFTEVLFTDLTANGSQYLRTTVLELTFNKDIIGLTAADISLNSGVTGVTKGTLTRVDTGIYELTVLGIASNGTISVTMLGKTGYNFIGDITRSVTAFYAQPAEFVNLTAEGSISDAVTTQVTLNFNRDITGFNTTNRDAYIIFDAGETGAQLGTITRNSTGIYTLQLTGIHTTGEVSITLTVPNNEFTPPTRTVMVYLQSEGATVDVPELNNKTYNSITINPVIASTEQTVQYAITTDDIVPTNDDDWQIGTTFVGLNAETTYYIFARVAENNNYLQGAPSDSLEVTTMLPVSSSVIEYYWVDEHGSLVTTSGGATTVAIGETLTITAQGTGYDVVQWNLNGADTGEKGDTYNFSSMIDGNYRVSLFVEKDSKLYITNIVITVVLN